MCFFADGASWFPLPAHRFGLWPRAEDPGHRFEIWWSTNVSFTSCSLAPPTHTAMTSDHRLNVFTVNTLLLPQKQAAPTVLCLSSCTNQAGASAAPTFDLLPWFCFLFLSCHFMSLTCLVQTHPPTARLLGHRDGGGRVTAAQVRCYTLANTERPPPAEAPNTDAAAATQTSRRGDAWAGRVVSVLKESVKAPECQRWTWRCVNMCLMMADETRQS